MLLPKDEAEFTGASRPALTSVHGVSDQLFLPGIKPVLPARELGPDRPKYPAQPGLEQKSGLLQQVRISGQHRAGLRGVTIKYFELMIFF